MDIFLTCGPSTRFFFLKSTGWFLIFLPRHTSHNCDARNSEEYVPIINPTAKARANPKMDCAPKIKKAKTAIKVVTDVLILRVNVCSKLLFTILASSLKDLTCFVLRKFSLILSKVTIVSFME